MFHMLSCFNLPEDTTIKEFSDNYHAFVKEMRSLGLVESSGPIGRRQSDTPMDTDDERSHEFYVVMNFRDRAQVDAAYAQIMKHLGNADIAHKKLISPVLAPVFICWEDLPA